MFATLTEQANLAAVDARSRLDSLTSDSELGALAPVDRDIIVAVVAFAVIVLCVVGLVANHLGLLG
jgi:hypothetical protein